MINNEAVNCVLKLAEETAYSSKGHFKSADWYKIRMNLYICIPVSTSLLTFGFDLERMLTQTLSFLGLVFSSLAFLSVNSGTAMFEKIKGHMDLANSYLEIHKQIRTLFCDSSSITKDVVDKFQEMVSSLDRKSSYYQIGFIARVWSRWVIKREMNLDWLERI